MVAEYLTMGLVLVGYYINIGRWTTLIIVIKCKRPIIRNEHFKIVCMIILMIAFLTGVLSLNFINFTNKFSGSAPVNIGLNILDICLVILVNLITLGAYLYIWYFMASQ